MSVFKLQFSRRSICLFLKPKFEEKLIVETKIIRKWNGNVFVRGKRS